MRASTKTIIRIVATPNGNCGRRSFGHPRKGADRRRALPQGVGNRTRVFKKFQTVNSFPKLIQNATPSGYKKDTSGDTKCPDRPVENGSFSRFLPFLMAWSRKSTASLERQGSYAHQADQAPTDFALIERHLETMAGQIARVPSRAFLCRMLLLATASIWALLSRGSPPVGESRCQIGFWSVFWETVIQVNRRLGTPCSELRSERESILAPLGSAPPNARKCFWLVVRQKNARFMLAVPLPGVG